MTAYGLDLGSTRIKLGRLDPDGTLALIKARNAPPVEGGMGKRVSDPLAWLSVADGLLKEVPPGSRLGISTQRSSFLLWERDTGKPLTPLISWQDVRAQPWVQAHPRFAQAVLQATGLPLAAHYAAPKLAWLLEDPQTAARASSGELLFGSLETWLVWNWTAGRHHVTDLSVAARTCLLALEDEDWSASLCNGFGVSPTLLPKMVRGETDLMLPRDIRLTALVADQTAGALPLFARYPNAAYVNGGTGTFLMRSATGRACAGFLTARTGRRGHPVFWEGGVNAGSALFKDVTLEADLWRTPADAFSIGDQRGLGAPYWRGDVLEARSASAQALSPLQRRRVDVQGYLFRVVEVLRGLFGEETPERLIFSGGLAARPNLAGALADVAPCPVWLTLDHELGLWGAAWLAGGAALRPDPQLKRAPAMGAVDHVAERQAAWAAWMQRFKGPADEADPLV